MTPLALESNIVYLVNSDSTEYGLTMRQISHYLLWRYKQRVSVDRIRRTVKRLEADNRVFAAKEWVPSGHPAPRASAKERGRPRMAGRWLVKVYPTREREKSWRRAA